MTEIELFEQAQQNNIEVYNINCPLTKAMSLRAYNNYYIGLDKSFDRMSTAERKCVLAHEIGHCERGVFYTNNSSCRFISKCETYANKSAIRHLLPKDEMETLIKTNEDITVYLIAEHFEVTEDMVKFALYDYFKIEVA